VQQTNPAAAAEDMCTKGVSGLGKASLQKFLTLE
jgi:hypothetical protein